MAYNSTFKLQLSTAKLSTNQKADSLITIITTLLFCLTNSSDVKHYECPVTGKIQYK